MKSNKNSASEDTLGFLHNAITRGFLAKVGVQLDKFDKARLAYDTAQESLFMAEAEGDEEAIELFKVDMANAELMLAMSIDEKTLAAAAKWVQANEITFASSEEGGTSEIGDRLKAIKNKQQGKIIAFDDEKRA